MPMTSQRYWANLSNNMCRYWSISNQHRTRTIIKSGWKFVEEGYLRVSERKFWLRVEEKEWVWSEERSGSQLARLGGCLPRLFLQLLSMTARRVGRGKLEWRVVSLEVESKAIKPSLSLGNESKCLVLETQALLGVLFRTIAETLFYNDFSTELPAASRRALDGGISDALHEGCVYIL